jgi:hypothetical protein
MDTNKQNMIPAAIEHNNALAEKGLENQQHINEKTVAEPAAVAVQEPPSVAAMQQPETPARLVPTRFTPTQKRKWLAIQQEAAGDGNGKLARVTKAKPILSKQEKLRMAKEWAEKDRLRKQKDDAVMRRATNQQPLAAAPPPPTHIVLRPVRKATKTTAPLSGSKESPIVLLDVDDDEEETVTATISVGAPAPTVLSSTTTTGTASSLLDDDSEAGDENATTTTTTTTASLLLNDYDSEAGDKIVTSTVAVAKNVEKEFKPSSSSVEW